MRVHGEDRVRHQLPLTLFLASYAYKMHDMQMIKTTMTVRTFKAILLFDAKRR
jgi:hypothetical protein